MSVVLSFFGICWSLASFNKNVRSKDIDKLVLTWIGVIFQLLWRLGTVSSRVLALVVYASAWPDWIILVVSCFYKLAIAICSKTPSRMLGILEYIDPIEILEECNSDQRKQLALEFSLNSS